MRQFKVDGVVDRQVVRSAERPSGCDAGENILMIDRRAAIADRAKGSRIFFGGDQRSSSLQREDILDFERPDRRSMAAARQSAIDDRFAVPMRPVGRKTGDGGRCVYDTRSRQLARIARLSRPAQGARPPISRPRLEQSLSEILALRDAG